MKIKTLSTVILLAVVLSITTLVSADGVNKRIRFAKGKSSTVISGGVVRGDRDVYTLGARAGQTMKVNITSVEDNAVFQIQGPDGSFLFGANEGDDTMSWADKLDYNGEYKITVGGTRGNATYKLRVSIK